MPAYSGKYEYVDETGAEIQDGITRQGPCRFSFDEGSCIFTPHGGTPLAFDLGDIDRVTPGEWALQLDLYTGRSVRLKQFGAAFSGMCGELLAAWRDRTVECLILEDLEEAARYQGAADGAPAEIRIFKSNLAVLPQAGLPVQWRLAEIDSCVFDAGSYSIVLESPGRRLVLSKLARKTDEAFGCLCGCIDALHTQAAAALLDLFPFLNADALRRVQRAMPESRSCALPTLAAIHPEIPGTLRTRAVDESLAPYFEALQHRSKGAAFAGFKFTQGVEAAEGEGGAEGSEPDEPLFFWYFFPLAGNILAWEATTGSGRATYFFRTDTPVESAVARLTSGLALVNFRREPVYLPDDSLEQNPHFRRYAIGARKLPGLRGLRAAYIGRAVHSSPENWLSQVNALTAGP